MLVIFWFILDHDFGRGYVSVEQVRTSITLIRKPQKDIRYIMNWRLIVLVNTDYSIVAKCFARRMKKVPLKFVVKNNQVS